MHRILASFLFIVAGIANAGPTLLKDIDTAVAMLDEAPVAMGGHWYFSSCNDGTGCELWRTDGTGPGTMLVLDIGPGSLGSNPAGLTAVGGTLYFAADDGVHGVELWKSDGTPQGTMLVRDIVPGPGGSQPDNLVAAGGHLFFAATTPDFGKEPWRSDGTAGGTFLLRDARPGASSSHVHDAVAFGSLVIFTAYDGVSGFAPWRSDGTPAGTFRLKAVNRNTGFDPLPAYEVAGPFVYFRASDGAAEGTYRSDGTVEGTIFLGPPAVGGRYTASGSRVFFAATQEATGTELWVSDGTLAGTRIVKDIRPGTQSGDPFGFAAFGSGVLFSSMGSPWFSDGTEAGTLQLASTRGLSGFLSFGATAVFSAFTNEFGGELWSTDGTPAGTRMVRDLYPGMDLGNVGLLAKAGPYVFMVASDAVGGPQLWRTDGTAEGTILATRANDGSAHMVGMTFLTKWFAIGSRLMYSTSANPRTVFVTDGVPGEPVPLVPVAGQPTRGSSCPNAESRAVGPIVYFVAFDPLHGCELWRTDGTPTGTALVKDIRPGHAGSSPTQLTAVNGWLYFVAQDASVGVRVWRTDGTEAGTLRVESDATPMRSSGGVVPELAVAGDAVYFVAASLSWGYLEPWRTAIGSTVAHAVSSLKPGLALKDTEFLVAAGSSVFFAANDFVHGRALWKSDGTPEGTMLVKYMGPALGGAGFVYPYIAAAAGLVFFVGPDSALWSSDGTEAGTAPFLDAGGAPIFNPHSLKGAGSLLFFGRGRALWRSDGTPAGTHAVWSVPGQGVAGLTVAGPWVYFATGTFAVDSSYLAGSWRLWRSDGTVAGTVLVRDTPAGVIWSTSFGQRLYFHTPDAAGRLTMHRTEGTAASTVELFDISTPDFLVPAGFLAPAATAAGLFLFDNDPVAGFEPSFLPLEPWLDVDGDGIPDTAEAGLGRDPLAMDNDIFADARLFAMQQYRDFLGREGDATGISAWSGAVSANVRTRAQMIDDFTRSEEFGGFVAPVVRLYFATFLRVPDYEGLTFNAALVRSGTVTPAQLADFFAGSPEFVSLYGALDNADFVTLLYRNVLGREPDAAGLYGWVSLLYGGMSRGRVLLGFSDSLEYQAAMANEVLVTMMYTGMLRRTPDSSGFNGWVGFLDAGTYTREQVIDGFFLSGEYRARFLP